MGSIRKKQSASKNKKIAADFQIFFVVNILADSTPLESVIALAIKSAKIILFFYISESAADYRNIS